MISVLTAVSAGASLDSSVPVPQDSRDLDANTVSHILI